ncbi:class I SAM-dependent methyltransferase [Lysinibacter cavernae]|uniref:SAM-dependent methyltransferase n=1 Tax=Lysinibacter cavernae TaxID=1640652 RepID=A0A7X5TSJ0_9MICO|nr:class I SAM-dependent methyltransferase [Lysinibacter cavernae]NIH52464.1 SAM-dependent methyltransferase [Lysinibacter cavernae]
MHNFDREFWEQHWHERNEQHGTPNEQASPANPYLAQETASLTPGTALDAGCGTGTEAIWLASQGWQVTGADISSTALEAARQATVNAAAAGQNVADRLTWVEADLTVWQPEETFDLVVTNYAHPTIPQLEFYSRLADWVSPGGTLLVIGHLHGHGDHGDGAHADHAGSALGHDSHGDSHHGDRPEGRPERDRTPDHSEHNADGSATHDNATSALHPPVESTVTPAEIAALLPSSDWRIEISAEYHREFAGDHPLRLHDAVVRATRIV